MRQRNPFKNDALERKASKLLTDETFNLTLVPNSDPHRLHRIIKHHLRPNGMILCDGGPPKDVPENLVNIIVAAPTNRPVTLLRHSSSGSSLFRKDEPSRNPELTLVIVKSQYFKTQQQPLLRFHPHKNAHSRSPPIRAASDLEDSIRCVESILLTLAGSGHDNEFICYNKLPCISRFVPDRDLNIQFSQRKVKETIGMNLQEAELVEPNEKISWPVRHASLRSATCTNCNRPR